MVEAMVVPKRPFRLPEVLSREEVERLIQCAAGPLHRIWLLTLYATGMRREELVQLRIDDIDSGRMVIHIRQGKGKKDRDIMLSPRLLQELRNSLGLSMMSRSFLRHHAQPETAAGTSQLLAFSQPQAEDSFV